MKYLFFEFNVLVNDKQIQEYEHQGNIFVEGRRKSNFELEFTNNSDRRVLVIPSVDGLCTLDGTVATPTSRGYIVNSRRTIKIPGWTLDNSSVAKFVFQDKERSYAKHASPNGVANTGVLGVLVYDEEIKYHHHPLQSTLYQNYSTTVWPHLPMTPTITCSTSSACSTSADTTQLRSTNAVGDKVIRPMSLGTGFGAKTTFATTESPFRRGSKLAEMIVYYDDRKGLGARGIKFGRAHALRELPKAFSTGCAPPPGWNG